MNDLIDRQAAIDALQKEINKGIPPFDDVMGSIRCGVRLARNIIEDLPSAQPQRGKWIDYSDEGYVECPFCHSATNCDGNKDELHYCFSCGAELRPQFEEPEINPCRGCEDYDGKGGCKTKGGCADRRGDSE